MKYMPLEERKQLGYKSGRALKPDVGYGKEWYAIYKGVHEDVWMELIADKVALWCPYAKNVSIAGVCIELLKRCPEMFAEHHYVILIHKKRLRKFLRRAVAKALIAYK